MRAWILFLMTILIVFTTQSLRANDIISDNYRAEDKEHDKGNVAKCHALSDDFHLLDDGVPCFSSDISVDTIKSPKNAIDEGIVTTLYINSLGGVTTAVMELGRSIYAKNDKLVLHKACFSSSCANYLPILLVL